MPPRPIRLFERPEPVEAMAEVPEGPPITFRWRRALHRVVAAEGPERIEPEWWREDETRPRDYYRIEDEAGRRYWLYRQGLYAAEATGYAALVHARDFRLMTIHDISIPAFAEFAVQSNFSFLRGASHPEELVVTAKRLGLAALGLADRNTVSGVVRAHQAAKEAGLAYHPGARLEFFRLLL